MFFKFLTVGTPPVVTLRYPQPASFVNFQEDAWTMNEVRAVSPDGSLLLMQSAGDYFTYVNEGGNISLESQVQFDPTVNGHLLLAAFSNNGNKLVVVRSQTIMDINNNCFMEILQKSNGVYQTVSKIPFVPDGFQMGLSGALISNNMAFSRADDRLYVPGQASSTPCLYVYDMVSDPVYGFLPTYREKLISPVKYIVRSSSSRSFTTPLAGPIEAWFMPFGVTYNPDTGLRAVGCPVEPTHNGAGIQDFVVANSGKHLLAVSIANYGAPQAKLVLLVYAINQATGVPTLAKTLDLTTWFPNSTSTVRLTPHATKPEFLIGKLDSKILLSFDLANDGTPTFNQAIEFPAKFENLFWKSFYLGTTSDVVTANPNAAGNSTNLEYAGQVVVARASS